MELKEIQTTSRFSDDSNDASKSIKKQNIVRGIILLGIFFVSLFTILFLECQFICKDGEKCRFGFGMDKDCPDESYKDDNFTCRDGSTFIAKEYVCNGIIECRDESDEDNCIASACKGFWCATDNQCIRTSWRCDDAVDCSDGSDEDYCDGNCSEIKSNQRCDGKSDCLDGSDEQNCEDYVCPEFACRSGSQCFSSFAKCDNKIHCIDGSDEENCVDECSEDEFMCKNRQKCVPNKWRCDGGRPDCFDGTDEENCVDECSEDEFMCKNGQKCIPNSYICDSYPDCFDGTDEENCEIE